jgi:hypothetical protein
LLLKKGIRQPKGKLRSLEKVYNEKHRWYSSNPDKDSSPVRTTIGISKRGDYADRDFFELGEKSLGQTIDQDTIVFILQQHGLRSRGFNRAYFAGQEKRIRRFHEMIESYFE